MIKDKEAGFVVIDLVKVIRDNKDFLSEIDGKIGDGDHGINMNKGFTLCEEKLKGKEFGLSEGLSALSETLQEDIGGSMGPLYGAFFGEMAFAAKEVISPEVFGEMLGNGIAAIEDIGSAKRGDKTLLDTLLPAKEAYHAALEAGKDFAEALEALKKAALDGWKSTENMIARIGRASRLGERSKGVLDAGATSCYLLLTSMAQSFQRLL
ncbi:MAG TPA: dihydroxyacetone kinase subunit L [Clostridiales bacterium]|nr:dihydroxyacetone kinase subunit L [Clostridiales bacterium]